MPSIHILLVDDEQEFTRALSRRLVNRGYEVSCALCGEKALGILDQNQNIDVVLLDIRMPGLGGLETLRRIKTAHPLVETIMLTAYATVATAVEAIQIGARDYLIKPCDLTELTNKVEASALLKRERERKIFDVRTRPYLTVREKEELIADIMDS